MNLTGQNFIGKTLSTAGNIIFHAINPANGEILQPAYHEATAKEVDAAVQKAADAFQLYCQKNSVEKAVFLETIAEEIMALGDELGDRYCTESALPKGRFEGERGRTVFQLRLFAQLLRDGSWVDARIDTALPDRQPLPRPDLRSMQRPIGPVGVFGASNFPLAFSVAGGDTASALAAGCTVVVKAHPAHPGTCEMIGTAILAAAEKSGMPDGVFSMVQGTSTAVGMVIVQHPGIKAIGFTGSFRGGKALFDAASQRPEPIPVYAEMGSTNPVFILPEALRQNGGDIAKGLAASVTLGVGQFCTNPGLTILEKSEESGSFLNILGNHLSSTSAGVMLTAGIHQAYEAGLHSLAQQPGVQSMKKGISGQANNQGVAALLTVDATDFLGSKKMEEEVFGPSTLAVQTGSREELLAIARNLGGHLTATIFGTPADLEANRDLIFILEQKVGRLLLNGYPTGVEVCHSMVHGGPYPATTDSRSTSVGTGAITRFTRPVCYQNFPQSMLPAELKDDNPLNIWRLVDGIRSR
ncbi:MAG: aldehyde dehydrogenase family protein [Bacteroidetes bacterium]|nr:aldehyde dehydrogenase family protein [Bacteroidota bacterium]